MIEGVVDEDRRALVPLTLRGLRSTVTAQAIIDTGFSGAVAVPIPIGVQRGTGRADPGPPHGGSPPRHPAP